jgi:protein-tyrosine-phosphatase
VTDGHHRRAHHRPTPPHAHHPHPARAEFAGTFGPATIERFLTDSLDKLLSRGKDHDVHTDLRRTLRNDRLTALAKIEGHLPVTTASVLFLCVHNAGRSQMAAGWLQHLAGDHVTVYTGGSEPASEINPNAIAAMAEVGIDITSNCPKRWTDEIVRAADVVVTMGCGDACPVFPGKRYEDWELDDPAGQSLAAVRPIRDDIRRRVEQLIESLQLHHAAM